MEKLYIETAVNQSLLEERVLRDIATCICPLVTTLPRSAADPKEWLLFAIYNVSSFPVGIEELLFSLF
jgi:hypothetical protein